MQRSRKPLVDLTAEEIMSKDVVAIPLGMSVKAAAHRLEQYAVSGAPVIDEDGRCVGVLSKSDLIRFLDREMPVNHSQEEDPSGYFGEWQVIDFEDLPEDAVARHMSTRKVTASPDTLVTDLARLMHEAHVHRILICDAGDRVVGVISSLDVLAVVASQDTADCLF